MIKYFSNYFARKFVEKEMLDNGEEEVCSYGLEIIISTVISVSGVMLISIANERVIEGAAYLIFYCSLRTYAGGYHAKTHKSCILTFLCIYVTVNIITKYVIFFKAQISVPLLIFCNITIILLKTVDAPNNPFSKYNKDKMHKIAISIMLSHSVLIFCKLQISMLSEAAIYALAGDCVCCILVIIGYMEKNLFKRRKNYEKEKGK